MKATNLLRVAGYCRTSSEGQRDNTSIASQKADILRYAASRGWIVVRWYIDECKSGSTIEGREEFQQMMRDAAAGHFDVVLVYEISRLGRNGADIIETSRTLKRDYGVSVIDTRGTHDSGDRTRTMMNFAGAGMAEHERLSILERTRRGIMANARAGKPWTSHRPIGRDYDSTSGRWFVTDKGRAIAEALRRYVQGESLTDLCRELGLGDRKRISEWVAKGQLAGTYIARFSSPEIGIDEDVPIKAIPQVVEPELLAQVRDRLKHNRTFNRTDAASKYVLSGFIRCECCGKAMTGQTVRGTVYYRHHATADCSLASVRGDAVEPGVLDYLYRRFLDAPAFDAAVAKAMPTAEDREAKQAERKRAADRLAKVDREIANLVNAIVRGADPSLLIDRQDELKAERAHLSARLATIDDEVAAMPSAERVRSAALLTRLGLMSRYGQERDWRKLPIAEIKPFLLHLFGETNPTTKTGVSVGLDEDGRVVGTFRGNVEFDAEFCDGRILSKSLQKEIDVARMILRTSYDRDVAAANARRAEALAATGGDDSDPDWALRPFRAGKPAMAHRAASRFVARACVLAVLISMAGVLHADHVLVEPDDPRDPPTKIVGTILERTGSVVTIETAPGRTQEIPGPKIVEVEATKSEGQRTAEQLLAKHQFAEAFDALVDAETKERREWVKREILALAAVARREQGDRLGAAKFGLYLLENDPASPHADALPLAWQDEPLGVPEREAAKGWFDSESEPAQLLAASWLLGDPEFAAAAQAKLKTLSASIDRVIATLARLQLARRDPSQSPEDLAALVDKLPTAAKAGPYWLLGREYERAGDASAARIAYLRCGLGYEVPRELVASALVAAARSEANDPAGSDKAAVALPASERARLLQFAVERGGNTTSGREARALLESLRNEATRSR